MGKDLVKVITGIRRCGKSSLLTLIQEELLGKGVKTEDIFYLNFEDLANQDLCTAASLHAWALKAIAGRKKSYLFFDEIQEVAEWERCINSLRAAHPVDIYITGSNAALLSGELATYLAGRYKEVRVYPFSFAEFRELLHEEGMEEDIPADFQRYLDLGGMPFLHKLHFDAAASGEYLLDIFNSVVLKDIIQRENIRNTDLLERIIRYCMQNIGQPFSANSLSRFLKNEKRKPAPETLLGYLKMCENALLLYPARRQDLVGKNILTINEKYYVADHGLARAVLGTSGIDINLVLENIVYMELLRRGFRVTVGKTANGEVDFVAEKLGEKAYFQVAYLLASPETIDRETRSLLSVADNYPKYLLSLDDYDFSRDGIIHYHIRDWLLQ
jgi:predicted AAA+ superfamily ATPase